MKAEAPSWGVVGNTCLSSGDKAAKSVCAGKSLPSAGLCSGGFSADRGLPVPGACSVGALGLRGIDRARGD